MDICFAIDIVFTFFTTVTDSSTSLEITDYREIAIRYLRSWFLLDIISILPFDFLLSNMNINQVFRFARIGKLYKLIRMTRLAKLLKLLKSNKTVISRITEKLQLSAGFERLLFFTVFFFFFVHVSACLYVLLV